jgi:hypothetical protein
MNVKTFVLLSATATILSGLLFVVVALWIPGILSKPGNWTADASDTADLAALKQSYTMLVQDLAISQNVETFWMRIAAVISMVLVVINIALFVLIFNTRKKLAMMSRQTV